jgi:hypothetical protein
MYVSYFSARKKEMLKQNNGSISEGSKYQIKGLSMSNLFQQIEQQNK